MEEFLKSDRLRFDYAATFHVYGILWLADRVTWYVDGKALRTTSDFVPHEPLQIRMNAYVGNMQDPHVISWLGPIHDEDLPATRAIRLGSFLSIRPRYRMNITRMMRSSMYISIT